MTVARSYWKKERWNQRQKKGRSWVKDPFSVEKKERW